MSKRNRAKIEQEIEAVLMNAADFDPFPNGLPTKEKTSNRPDRRGDEQAGQTANGFDGNWIKAINQALENRGSPRRLVDLNNDLWARFIGPLVDAIENGEYYQDLEAVRSA